MGDGEGEVRFKKKYASPMGEHSERVSWAEAAAVREAGRQLSRWLALTRARLAFVVCLVFRQVMFSR